MVAGNTQLADVNIDDKYALERGRVFVTGSQALVRLPLLQRARDAAAGLNTAGYISGYQGSPLGGYDKQLWQASRWLLEAHVHFQPGVNEDLAATAIWGTQQLKFLPGPKYDGVFSIWYGKGPGVDRSGDPLKHGNRAGTGEHGGVLVVFGDDHQAKSSTIAFQSEQALAANGIPVLYPANIQEYLDFGLHGWAMSRFSGCYVGFKCVNETVEATASVQIAPDRIDVVLPDDVVLPVGGVNIRMGGFQPLEEEARLFQHKLPLVQAYARANKLDRVMFGADRPRLGIVTAGRSYLDVLQALTTLGIDEGRARILGISVYKAALIWPLEPQALTAFARGVDELLFVEEKASFMEGQTAAILYNLPDSERPQIVGKQDELGQTLLAAHGVLETDDIVRAIAQRLRHLGMEDAGLAARQQLLKKRDAQINEYGSSPSVRTPYFCSGCPHNSSTKVPEGSMAMSGIGCHAMVMWMDRSVTTPTQMGGEGLNWTGVAPFTETKHMFQNLGDGTYYHSGLLAIRGAVNSSANITYKILVNDAVAMTGGQPVLGNYSVSQIAKQVLAEGVKDVAVVTDDTTRYRGVTLPSGVSLYHRDQLDVVQREFRETMGTTVIVYDQTCAAEKRRRRKRNEFPDPPKRAFINELVCEGCGDCSVQANCVSILPKETEFGRKREIDQSNCNKDFSCVKGFCPSFVTVHGGELRKPPTTDIPQSAFADLPAPLQPRIDGSYDVLVTGIGGTGVITIGGVLGMAAHLEGKGVSVFDMTGLAQKNGAVYSHLRLAESPEAIQSQKIAMGEAELLLGCDIVAASASDALRVLDTGRTVAVLNSHFVPTAKFQSDRDADFHEQEIVTLLETTVGADNVRLLDATTLARSLLGNTIGANMMLVGYAVQIGHLPLSVAAVERAIELNGVSVDFNKQAFRLGRVAAHDLERLQALMPADVIAMPADTTDISLAQLVSRRAEFLLAYQNAAYANRFRSLVDRAMAVEQRIGLGLNGLAETVARNYFKLLAYKDEYEVARLYTDGTFRRQLDQQFEGSYRLKFHLAPPVLSRPDKETGIARKREFGGWVWPLLKLLAAVRWLRGTPFDIFGYTRERRMERRLIREYEATVAVIVDSLTPENHAAAVELAAYPQEIKGYGHVKERNVELVMKRRVELESGFRDPASQSAAA